MSKNRFSKKTLVDRPGGVTLSAPSEPEWRMLRYKMEREPAKITLTYLHSLPLTDRDRNIVMYLGEIGYASTEQLARLFFYQSTDPPRRASRRLKRLWELHILDRTPGHDPSRYGIRLQLVYMLGRAGIMLLGERNIDGAKAYKKRTTTLMAHNTLLGEALVDLTQTARALGDWQVRFYGERGAYAQFEYQGHSVKMRPDGLIVLDHITSGRERSIFAEMDTGTDTLNVYVTKVRQYEWYFRSNAWTTKYHLFPGIVVLVWVATRGKATLEQRQQISESRLCRVMDRVQDRIKEKSIRWFFARLDQAGSGYWRIMDQDKSIHKVCLFSEDKEP
ncbi:MAG: hypothetical protein GY832_35390 [Chloroflexi bacterium]|nr:hypothetical protein [Chloroflexota bacterium]